MPTFFLHAVLNWGYLWLVIEWYVYLLCKQPPILKDSAQLQTVRKVNGAQKGLLTQLHTGMRSVSLSKSLTMDCPASNNYSWSQIWEKLFGWVSFPCHPERKLYRQNQMVATKLIPKALQSASLQGCSWCCPGQREGTPFQDDSAEQRRERLQSGQFHSWTLCAVLTPAWKCFCGPSSAHFLSETSKSELSEASHLCALRDGTGVTAAVINGICHKWCWCEGQAFRISWVNWNVKRLSYVQQSPAQSRGRAFISQI